MVFHKQQFPAQFPSYYNDGAQEQDVRITIFIQYLVILVNWQIRHRLPFIKGLQSSMATDKPNAIFLMVFQDIFIY